MTRTVAIRRKRRGAPSRDAGTSGLRRSVGLAPLLALAAACAAPPGAGMTEAHRTAMQDSVRAFVDDWVAATNRDMMDVPAFYSDDASFNVVEDGVVSYASKAEIVEAFEQLGRSVAGADMTVADVRVLPFAPGVAHVTLRFDEILAMNDGTEIPIVGIATAIVRNGPAGWRFAVIHASTPRADRR